MSKSTGKRGGAKAPARAMDKMVANGTGTSDSPTDRAVWIGTEVLRLQEFVMGFCHVARATMSDLMYNLRLEFRSEAQWLDYCEHSLNIGKTAARQSLAMFGSDPSGREQQLGRAGVNKALSASIAVSESAMEPGIVLDGDELLEVLQKPPVSMRQSIKEMMRPGPSIKGGGGAGPKGEGAGGDPAPPPDDMELLEDFRLAVSDALKKGKAFRTSIERDCHIHPDTQIKLQRAMDRLDGLMESVSIRMAD